MDHVGDQGAIVLLNECSRVLMRQEKGVYERDYIDCRDILLLYCYH